jgi:hypothetical protein
MSGRAVSVRNVDGRILGVYEVRADGMTCMWTVRHVSGYAACIADAIDMVRRVASILDRRDRDFDDDDLARDCERVRSLRPF